MNILLAAFAASIVWFMVGGALYMNPFIAKMYKQYEGAPGVKKWRSIPKYLGYMFSVMFIPNIMWAAVYQLIKPVLPQSNIAAALTFGLILVAIKIFPRFFDMWIQSTYPNKLLLVELINGTIGSFVVAGVFAYLL